MIETYEAFGVLVRGSDGVERLARYPYGAIITKHPIDAKREAHWRDGRAVPIRVSVELCEDSSPSSGEASDRDGL